MLERFATFLGAARVRARRAAVAGQAVARHPIVRWCHGALVAIVLLWLARKFLGKLTPHYPVEHWLFWVYARIWVWVVFFTVACACGGHLLLGWIMPSRLSLRARLVFSFAIGVLAFFLGTFIAGLLRLYGSAFAIAWPATLIVVGGWPLAKRLERARRHLRAARRRAGRAPWWTWPVAGFGLLAVCAIYFTILTPGNVAFDAHFYHLGIAQDYAVGGGITRSQEGWLPSGIPHLASVLYTWAFLVPRFPLAERVLLASHLEFVLFLATLASVPVLVRWLCPRARTGLAWVAIFLFPGIYLYDSSLSTAADHIAAFWAPAVYLAFGQAWRDLDPRKCAILAAVLGGALLTKYQSAQLAILPALGILFRAFMLGGIAVWSHVRRRARLDFRFVVGPLVALVVGLLVTSPHWLKNWVWHGAPLYPFMSEHFSPHPYSADAAHTFNEYFQEYQIGSWRPQGTTEEKVEETLWAMWKFSFEPHDWPRFHGVVPVFGSLFTLLVFVLPLLRGQKRLWGIYLGANLAVLHWYWSMHQDRYLQVVLPWMAAGVAGTIILVWRMGIVPRLAMSALVGLQLIWGGDVYFIPTHSMLGTAPVKAVSDLLAAGYKKKFEGRLVIAGEFDKIAQGLPRGAKILNHEENRKLGYWRPVINDIVPWQFGIRWGRHASAGEMHATLTDFGVTHIVWRTGKSRSFDTLAGDLRFFEYVANYAGPAKRVGGRSVAAIAGAPPSDSTSTVAYLGCSRYYERGIHRLDALNVYEIWPPKNQGMVGAEIPAPSDPSHLASFVSQSDFVVVGPSCKPAVATSTLGDFVHVATRGKEQLWVRRRTDRPEPSPAAPAEANPGPDIDEDVLLR